MAYLHLAGLDNHGADAADFDRYDNVGDITWEAAAGRFGGGALRVQEDTNNLRLTVTNSAQQSGWAAFYFKRAIDPDDNAEFFLIGGGTPQLHFWIEVGNSDRKSGPTDNQIILLNQNDTLLGTSVNTFTGSDTAPGPWLHMECFWKLGQGDGEFKLWVDGVVEIDVASLTLGHPSTDLDDWRQWRVEGVQGFLKANDWVRLDDVVIQDVNGSQLGTSHRIQNSLPLSDTSTALTPSAGGDNFAMVDDSDPDQGSTYVQSTGVDQRDIYGHTPPSTTGTIGVVVVKALCTRASGSGDIKVGMKLGGSETLSAAISVDGSVYKEAALALTAKPGGGAWTQSDLDSSDIIVEATATGVRITQVWLEILALGTVPFETNIEFTAFIRSLGPPGQQAEGVNFNTFVRGSGVGDDVVKKLSGRHVGKIVT